MNPEIILLQTADAHRYLPMLQATAAVNQVYCARHNIGYSQFLGIKRGFYPWQACFNRVMIIREMIAAGYCGWVFYLDADAFVADLSFDSRHLISEIAKPLIMAPGGLTGEPWDVNTGVFLVDLNDETARELMLAWHSDIMSETDHALRESPEWEMIAGDQSRLHIILQGSERFRSCLGMADRYLFNDHKGSFVRQI